MVRLFEALKKKKAGGSLPPSLLRRAFLVVQMTSLGTAC